MTTAEIVPAEGIGALETLDPSARESAVTAYLAQARTQLAHAVEASGPAAVAALKAEIATAAEATKQLGLSREIQQDAQEMVRRAEYALGKAIRHAQEVGDVETAVEARHRAVMVREVNQGRADQTDLNSLMKPKPTDYASDGELYGNGAGIAALVDGVSDEQFEAALAEARDEGNQSRANVVRKVQNLKSDKITPAERLNKIGDMAEAGHTSDQIAQAIGNTPAYIRTLARENGIEIAADRVLARTSRAVDSNRVLAGIVESVSVPSTSLSLLDFSALDRALLGEWKNSLSESIKTLTRLRNRLEKELSNGQV